MDEAAVAQVRSFNRTVTQRVGALHDEYLARGRPLGASRVLWEVGDDGVDVRTLRARLDLDSGYLSRLLRSLEAAGLVTTDPDPDDRRARVVHLTVAGGEERDVLDRRSDELAWSLLAPLAAADRAGLVEAMARVERLLTAGLVRVGVEDPASDAAQTCLQAYFAELAVRFEAGFDPDRSRPADPDEMTEPAGLFLVARLHDEAARGLGVGRRLLSELEAAARARGVEVLRLDTNRTLHEAITLYRSAGFTEVPAFNDEAYAHHWFEKRIG
jgi:DNA-binding MarR family transcriptional regulator